MTTNASLLCAGDARGDPVLTTPDADWQLDMLAEAIRLALPPAYFAVWQDGRDSMRLFVDALIQAGLTTPHVIRPDSLAAKLATLEGRSWADEDGIVFLGCLSAFAEEEGRRFNSSRDRLLHLPTKMIFVESITDERKIRLGFPDVFSLVSYDCRLFLRAGEVDPFATSDSQRDGSGPSSTTTAAALSGTVDEVRADDAVCWLEIAPGTLVRFSVPLDLLRHLDPQPGLELRWSPGKAGKDGESPTFWRREPEAPDPELLREVRELNQRFREGLKTWQPRLPEDE